ncbi:tripartite tricarboxylate transporter TctB family protein [Sedimentibacter sp.]|uniref:tripartite tricarboxylate transporter TctB family protein n=1 Tax=Sedimentibacter sp. TaxID=1960295 RepID=UPI0028AFF533|nr:tripartite tricarboxylate transporter TctB family protein [Sedimentibacter sp.]
MDDKIRDLRSGIVIVLFSLFSYFWLIPNQISVRKGVTIGADYFPELLVTIIGICGAVLIIEGLIYLHKKGELSLSSILGISNVTQLKKYLPHVIFLLSTVIYLIVMQYLGFVIASIPFLIFLLLFFGHSKIAWCSVVSVIFVVAIYLLFSNVFRIRFPVGPFGF